jgi:hypothetical protein
VQRCKFIRFGDMPFSDTLTERVGNPNYFANSMMLQLHKDNRKFAYHVRMLPRNYRFLKHLINNGRDYVIHINMHRDCDNQDQMRAYYFARLLDEQLAKIIDEPS